MLADVRAGIEALTAAAPAARHDDWLARTQKYREDWYADAAQTRGSDHVPLRPERLCADLNAVLPDDAIVVADTGFSAL